MTTTGERLTRLREKLGKSQAQIAELIGVDRTSYAKYEKDVNKPTRKLKELSELFNVTSDYIMCLSDTPSSPAPGSKAPTTGHQENTALDSHLVMTSNALGDSDTDDIQWRYSQLDEAGKVAVKNLISIFENAKKTNQ